MACPLQLTAFTVEPLTGVERRGRERHLGAPCMCPPLPEAPEDPCCLMLSLMYADALPWQGVPWIIVVVWSSQQGIWSLNRVLTQ